MMFPRRSSARAVLGAMMIALAAACSDDPASPKRTVPDGFGTLEGQWDGKAWSGVAYGVLLDDDSLRLIAFHEEESRGWAEWVRATVPYEGERSYAVPAESGQLAQIVGGDAGWMPRSSGTLRVSEAVLNMSVPAEPVMAQMRGTVSLTSTESYAPWSFSGSFKIPVYRSYEDVPWER